MGYFDEKVQESQETPTATIPQRPGGISYFGGKPQFQQDRSLEEATVGAFQYGTADVGRSVFARLGRAFNSEGLNNVAQSFQQFKNDNPQYAPVEVDSAFDLITSPTALASHFSAGAPFLLAVGGLATVGSAIGTPFTGLALSFGLAYAVESQNAYEQAKASGADENAASTVGNLVGAINGTLNTFLAGRLFGPAHSTISGALGSIGREALNNTLTAGRALGITGPALRSLAVIAAENSLMGAVREGIPARALGQPIPEGFLHRRLTETIDGAVLGEVFGGVKNLRSWAMGKEPRTSPQGDPASMKLDILSSKDFENRLSTEFAHLPENQIIDNVNITNAFAHNWGQAEGKDPGEFYARIGFGEGPDQDVIQSLAQGDKFARNKEIGNVKWSFGKMREAISKEFAGKEEISVSDLQGMVEKSSRKINADDVEWTGIGDKIREVGEGQRGMAKLDLKELLTDLDRGEMDLAKGTLSDAEVSVIQGKWEDLQREIEVKGEEFATLLQKAKKPEEQQQIQQAMQKWHEEAAARGEAIREESYAAAPRWMDSQTPADAWGFRNVLVKLPTAEGGEKSLVFLHLDERQTPEGQATHLSEIRDVSTKAKEEPGGKTKNGMQAVKVTSGDGKESWEVRDGEKILVSGVDEAAAGRSLSVLQESTGVKSEEGGKAPKGKEKQDGLMLGVKQLVWEAVQNGSKFITWSTGEERQQVQGAVAKDGLEAVKSLMDKKVPKAALELVQSLDPKAVVETVKTGTTSDGTDLFSPGIRLSPELRAVVLEEGLSLEQGSGRRSGGLGMPDEVWDRTLESAEDFKTRQQKREEFLGKSVIKDPVYHGTAGEFTSFNTPAHFGTKEIAARVAYGRSPKDTRKGESILPVYLRVENPLRIKDTGTNEHGHNILEALHEEGKVPYEDYKKFRDQLEGTSFEKKMISLAKKLGYDGLSYINQGEADLNKPLTVDTTSYMIFDPNQVKSVNAQEFNTVSPDILFQTNKASVRLYRDATGVERALVKAGKDPDASSVLEEMFHIAERWVIRGEDRAKAEQALQVEDGLWTVPKRESLAKMFLQYAREGRSPDPLLQGAFARVSKWMLDIYPNILKDERINGGKYQLGDELRGIFDRMFYADTDPVKAKRLQIQDLNRRLEALGGKIPTSTEPADAAGPTAERARAEIFSGTSDGDARGGGAGSSTGEELASATGDQVGAGGGESEASRDPSTAAERRRILEELQHRRNELWDLQAGQFRPGVESPQALRARENNILPGLLGSQTGNEFFGKRIWRSLTEPFARGWDATVGMRDKPSGQRWLEKRDMEEAYKRLKTAQFLPELEQLYKMPGKDLDALVTGEVRPSGMIITGIQTMLDPGPQPSIPLQRYSEFFRRIGSAMLEEGQRAGEQRRTKEGYVPLTSTNQGFRVPRILTENLFDAISRGSGKLFNKVLEGLQAEHPEVKPELIRQELLSYADTSPDRLVGNRNRTSYIKVFPAQIMIDGRVEALLKSDPYAVALTALRRGFGRIASIKEFGQGVLKTVGTASMRQLLKVMNVPVDRINKDTLGLKLEAGGIPKHFIDQMTRKEMVKLTKVMGIELRETRDELLAKVSSLRANDLYVENQPREQWPSTLRTLAELKKVAIRLRGIDPLAEPADLLQGIKKRTLEEVEDSLHNKLRDSFAREGGDLTRFDQIANLAQGVPLKPLPPNVYTKGIRFISAVVGASQTSTSSAPNLPQPLALVPGLAGLKAFGEAVSNVARDPQGSKSQVKALGAFLPDIISRTTEPGYTMLSWGKKLQQGISTVTGLRFLAERNNVIAGEAFRLMGKDWLKGGFTNKDIALAKRLRMSDAEIGKLQKGGLDPEQYQFMLAKIVQNGVNITQFVTEAPYRRGLIESHPIGRLLLSYFSYTAGMTRSTGQVMDEWKRVWSTKDPAALFGAIKRTTLTIAGTAGAGVASLMLRQAIKGQVEQRIEKDEDLFHMAWAGLWETQLFGGTQRMLEPFQHDNGIVEIGMIGLFPQISAVSKVVGAAFKYGKFGRFDFQTRVVQAGKQQVPLLRGIDNWIEAWAYPERSIYNRARGQVREFTKESELGVSSAGAGDQLEPLYWDSAEALANNDMEGLFASSKKFYATAYSSLKPGQDPRRIVQNYRASLMNRAPINLSNANEIKFLVGLGPEKRREFMRLQGRYTALVDAIAPRPSR